MQQTDDRRLPGWDTNVVLDPAYAAGGEAGERVAYALGGVVDRGRVVGLAAAETAVRTWLHSGTRDSGLTWRHLRMRGAHPQPTALGRTD